MPDTGDPLVAPSEKHSLVIMSFLKSQGEEKYSLGQVSDYRPWPTH